jgi:hypothetical protein
LFLQRIKKCPLNRWVKLRFIDATGKSISYTLHSS